MKKLTLLILYTIALRGYSQNKNSFSIEFGTNNFIHKSLEYFMIGYCATPPITYYKEERLNFRSGFITLLYRKNFRLSNNLALIVPVSFDRFNYRYAVRFEGRNLNSLAIKYFGCAVGTGIAFNYNLISISAYSQITNYAIGYYGFFYPRLHNSVLSSCISVDYALKRNISIGIVGKAFLKDFRDNEFQSFPSDFEGLYRVGIKTAYNF